jgi:hypothetical protein
MTHCVFKTRHSQAGVRGKKGLWTVLSDSFQGGSDISKLDTLHSMKSISLGQLSMHVRTTAD